VLTPVANQIVGAGIVLTLTNVATDPNVPPQTLAFSALAVPSNATVNATSGVVAWRPLISQMGTPHPFSIRVTDNGAPNLSATNNFVISVNLVSQPTLSLVNVGISQVSLSATGLLGPDYTLLTSTNLVNWQPLFTTNPAAMPVQFADTNRSDAARFYRLQLGP